jgi:hypothetical protein
MTAVRVAGTLDRNLAWDGARMYEDADLDPGRELPVGLRGAVASVRSDTTGRLRIVRDPLGINKLFWAEADETITLAARPRRLTQAGHAFDAISAIPRGAIVDLDPAGGHAAQHAIQLDGLRARSGGHEARIGTIARAIGSSVRVPGCARVGASSCPRVRRPLRRTRQLRHRRAGPGALPRAGGGELRPRAPSLPAKRGPRHRGAPRARPRPPAARGDGHRGAAARARRHRAGRGCGLA